MRSTGKGRVRGSMRTVGALLAGSLVVLLILPFLALVLSTTPNQVMAGLQSPAFAPALGLSLRTSLISLVITLLLGTPLAWWLAQAETGLRRAVSVLVELPIVVPPAVVGVALLQTFGREGLLGYILDGLGVGIPFTATAVVIAQIVVAAPFYVQAAASSFRRVEPEMLTVARTLGASPSEAFLRVALPIARPGLVAGASLAWARALGEFGATLLFAGNMPGVTQTMPLAIFTALESDVQVAIVLSLVLGAIALLLLAALRLVPQRGVEV